MKSLSLFFLEVLGELKKIQWPSRSEFITSTISTIIVVFIFSLFFAFVDSVIGYSVKSLILFFT